MMNETDVGGEGENQRHIFWGMRSKEQGVGKKRVGIEYTLQFKEVCKWMCTLHRSTIHTCLWK